MYPHTLPTLRVPESRVGRKVRVAPGGRGGADAMTAPGTRANAGRAAAYVYKCIFSPTGPRVLIRTPREDGWAGRESGAPALVIAK